MAALDTFEANMGPVEIYEDHLTIFTRTLAFFKTKLVPSDVVFAQIKRIERHPKGTRSPRFASVHIDTGAVNNVINRLENEMTFETDAAMEDAYAKIMKHYQTYLNKQNGGTVIQQASPADELKKFKELLDSGIITQEEFEAKKKQLLGL